MPQLRIELHITPRESEPTAEHLKSIINFRTFEHFTSMK